MTPAYHRPDQPLPSTFGPDAVPATAATAELPGADQWWASFHSPELIRLIEQGTAENLDLEAAVARIEEARATARMQSASLLPSASLSGSAVETRGGTLGDYRLSSSSSDLLLQMSYELDLFGRLHAQANSARALAAASAFDRDALRLSLTATIADTYFRYLALQDRLRAAGRMADDAERILALVEERRKIGSASEVDVGQQRTIASVFAGAIPVLGQQSEQVLHDLAVLVGRPSITVTATSLAGIDRPDIGAGLPSSLLARRPDIRAAEARLIAANFDVGAARAAFFPSISLTGQGGLLSGSIADVLNPAKAISGSAFLLEPLFNAGRLSAQVRYDRARARELAANYRQSILLAFKDAADALAANARLGELEAEYAASEAAAGRSLALAQTRYRYGTIDLLTLLDTQRSYEQALDLLIHVRLERLQASVALYRALAGGYDPTLPDAMAR